MARDPFIEVNPIVAAMEQHRAKIQQVGENTARLAQSYATYTTAGDGNHMIPDPHLFGCTFTEQPMVAYGYSLEGDQLVDGAGWPRCHGFIQKWVQDEKDNYIGAHVCLVVSTNPVTPNAPDPAPTEDTNATPPTTPTRYSFSDTFDRANSPLIGNGWVQVGGDWDLNQNSVSSPDPSSYLVRPAGRMNLTVQADLRTPDGGHPCVFAWTNSRAGAGLGYALAFSGQAQGTNLVLYRSGKEVRTKHFGPAGQAIGNVTKRLKLSVASDGATVTVRAFVDGSEQFTFIEPLAQAPTGYYVGMGNRATGNVRADSFLAAELDDPAEPVEPEPAVETPVFIIDHDFTFTGIAMKDLPEHLLDGGA